MGRAVFPCSERNDARSCNCYILKKFHKFTDPGNIRAVAYAGGIMIEEPLERNIPMRWSVLGIFLASLLVWTAIATLVLEIV